MHDGDAPCQSLPLALLRLPRADDTRQAPRRIAGLCDHGNPRPNPRPPPPSSRLDCPALHRVTAGGDCPALRFPPATTSVMVGSGHLLPCALVRCAMVTHHAGTCLLPTRAGQTRPVRAVSQSSNGRPAPGCTGDPLDDGHETGACQPADCMLPSSIS